MIEELDFKTFLNISSNKFSIYLFDIKNSKNLYKNEFKFNENQSHINLNDLDKFLEKNIFKIEKSISKFVKNISLILQHDKIFNADLGIKKKNYEKKISKKKIEHTVHDAKELFKENFPNEKIMHIIINKYQVNDIQYPSFEENLNADFFCLELKFIFISNNLTSEIEKILEKYQIKVNYFLDAEYIKNLFLDNYTEISNMAYKVQNGFNKNEVKLIPKNIEKKGFFEKFFQLFS